jgi:hypothetical protein
MVHPCKARPQRAFVLSDILRLSFLEPVRPFWTTFLSRRIGRWGIVTPEKAFAADYAPGKLILGSSYTLFQG